jgi:uncharacterized protein (TIGR01777 family)
MRIAVFGGSGFIGGHLIRELVEQGEEVVNVSRSLKANIQDHIKNVTWQDIEVNPELLDGFDAFVNLAGESINQRWTKAAKERIVQSRLDATNRIARLVRTLKNKPEVIVNGSGMSIYGYSDTGTFDEKSPRKLTDFLGKTVDDWEKAVNRIQGVRIVKLRIGLVLGKDGGAFPLMVVPYRLFAGGKIGNGRQIHSWIHIKDMVGIIKYSILHKEVNGAINCTAPKPVSNNEFGRAIGKVLGRPHWFPAPGFMFKLILGEMSEVILKGQRVLPKRILEYGYVFSYATLERALKHILIKPDKDM